MKNLNKSYIDKLINKVITETLEEKVDKLVSKINEKKIPTDDEVDKMMSSEVNEKMETCEQCGGETTEGDICEQCRTMNESDEFDYVEEEVDFDDEETEETEETQGNDLESRTKRFCDRDNTKEYNRQSCEYHLKLLKNSGTVSKDLVKQPINMNEKLHGGQKKLDKNNNGKLDSEDFEILRNNKKSIKLSESEMIDLIEKIVIQEQKSNIKSGTAKGLEKYKQIHTKDGKENRDSLKATAKKMKEYLKSGSKGEYKENPNFFPKGNGELAKMSKKGYTMSDDGKEFVDDFISPGMEDLVPDEIQYDNEWVSDNIKGSSKTGNNPEWGNAVKTDLGDKISKKLTDKKFRKAKEQAYRKSKQPVTDGTGDNSGNGINIKLESIDPKTSQKINEEFNRIKSLMGYNQKTQ
jgi:hypothetical protein